ncbi:MAG: YdeI/OmpD-associated family protein [Pseudomonadota bacterium]|uniref:DUF1801 domain-containing protein n=1 Tax=Sphingobium sp. TaxID=1912891 RepID=UPI002E206BFA
MTARSDAVDTYIAGQADFARPIVAHVRALVHDSCPDTVEAIKWGFPHFVYRGKNLASIAAFSHHAAVGLWYGEDAGERDGMGQLGKIRSLADLPSDDDFRALLAQSVALIEAGAKPPRLAARQPREPLPVHPDLAAAIDADPAAAAVWAAFPPGKQRDYAEWIGEAKTDPTRERRIAEAVAWIAEGKGRNWKYEKC